MIDTSKLVKNLIMKNYHVLTEAEGTPEKLVNEYLQSQGVNEAEVNNEVNNMEEDNDQNNNNNEQNNNQNTQQNNENNQENQQQDQASQGEDFQNDYSINNMDQDQYQEQDIQDDYDPKDDIPKLKILNTLSDSEYKLNNLRCFDQFRELKKNVENYINNNIMDVTTKNSRQRQIVDIVHNNLSTMISDMDNYMIYRFGDIYEDNVIAYITYLKRYHIAIKIIKLIVDENIKNSNPENTDN